LFTTIAHQHPAARGIHRDQIGHAIGLKACQQLSQRDLIDRFSCGCLEKDRACVRWNAHYR
jgi:hypothetical protein